MGDVKHTLGPWAMNPVCARVDAFTENGPLPICELLWPTELRSEDETEANARLIAAAPDLLEALKLFVRPTMKPPYLTQKEFDESPWIVAARAAIAKALNHTTDDR